MLKVTNHDEWVYVRNEDVYIIRCKQVVNEKYSYSVYNKHTDVFLGTCDEKDFERWCYQK